MTDTTPTLDAPAEMSHRAVLSAMSGLMLGMFVAILASTVVSTSLPVIISDLGGSQTSYTWVVTATLLATTVSTPIWGKLSDLMSRKLLVQISLVLFVLGSALAGFSQDTGTLIAFRVVQGLGAGGLTALVQVVLADIISPRQRGKYMGILGAVMAVGTVGGPLLGGFITDGIGWRWNFFIGAPIAVVAIILIQRTLHLPDRRSRVSIDFLGAALLAGGVSLLLVWISLAGSQFAWGSWESLSMVGGAVLLLVALVVVELRVEEPILPMQLFRNRTFVLSIIASISVGTALFGTSVFLSQYMQLARGATASESGVLTIPMVAGTLIASTIVGALISRTGHWKAFMVTGSVLLAVGLGLMSTIHYDTAYPLVAIYMLAMGLGIGMTMQNLVLVVQNSVSPRQLGVASSGVAFFRSLGGTIGVSVMGAILASRVSTLIRDGLVSAGVPSSATSGLESGAIPDLSSLPAALRTIVESAYGDAIGEIFLVSVPLALLTIVMVAMLPNRELGSKTAVQQLAEERAAEAGRVSV